MLLRLSTLFFRTLREDPADADLPSTRLLLRAGYVRVAAPGSYAFLPLGRLVLGNLERVIREELEATGAQEVAVPVAGVAPDEAFARLVKDVCASYKELPVTLAQVRTASRDEARPRAGLLGCREPVVHESVSFDRDGDGMRRSYQAHRDAYRRVLDRLGLRYAIVGGVPRGGSASEQFVAPCDAGDSCFARCRSCGYAASIEAVRVAPPPPADPEAAPPARVVDTPDTPTIASLVHVLNTRAELRRDDRAWTPADTLKNVVVTLVAPDGQRTPLVVGVPGDRELDVARLAAYVAPAVVEPFSDADFAAHPTLVRGYLGPGALGMRSASGVRYLVDPRVDPGSRWVTGANEPGRHVVGLVAGRDFVPDGTIDAAEVRAGDPCPGCGSGLALERGIRLAQLAELGSETADALGVAVLDESGRRAAVTMGSYGMDVTRALAAIVEQTHDDLGLCWPRSIAPADVHVVATGKDSAVFVAADQLARDVEGAGLRVLLDDRRGVSPGVKFADAELFGVPTIVVVGKLLAQGEVEVRDRRTGRRSVVPVAAAVPHIAP